jgi:hypothetical protein
MFTFYDDMYDFEEESWNICFNETLGKWITFYSWIPSFSENIYNVYFSFDRDTSKNIAKLGICNSDSDFADGITLSNNLLSDELDKTKSDDYWIVGELGLKNRNIPTGDGITTTLEFEIIRDVWSNYDDFKIETIDGK